MASFWVSRPSPYRGKLKRVVMRRILFEVAVFVGYFVGFSVNW